jgi:hypothetical protein
LTTFSEPQVPSFNAQSHRFLCKIGSLFSMTYPGGEAA